MGWTLITLLPLGTEQNAIPFSLKMNSLNILETDPQIFNSIQDRLINKGNLNHKKLSRITKRNHNTDWNLLRYHFC